MGLGHGFQREGLLFRIDMGCCVVLGLSSFLSNNSAWDWERGLQGDGLLSRIDMGCCVVMGGNPTHYRPATYIN